MKILIGLVLLAIFIGTVICIRALTTAQPGWEDKDGFHRGEQE